MTANPLANLTVLVTRPEQQQDNFNRQLRQLGAIPASLPCLAILPLPDNQTAVAQLAHIDQADAVIFISTNAVAFADALRPMPWSPPPQRTLAVGPTTAAALAQRQLPVSVQPVTPYNSESLLALPMVKTWLQRNQLQNIAVIKGQGGRPYLRETLTAHGIATASIDVYRRARPALSPEQISSVFLNSRPDIVTITSDEALTNLVALAGSQHQDQLLNLPLVVNSKRNAALARQLGFQSHILVAPVPGDSGQLTAIKQWIRSNRQ